MLGATLGFVAACGGIGNPDPDKGDVGDSCTSDDNCKSELACHIGLGECEETCESPSSCGGTQSVCASIPTATGGQTDAKFCQCAVGAAGDETCSDATEGAEPFCNTKTLRCSATQEEEEVVLKELGEDCDASDECEDDLICHSSEGFCTYSCDSTEAQPSTCGYGNLCLSNGCVGILASSGAIGAADTCDNLTASPPSWTSSSTAPVIYEVSAGTPRTIYGHVGEKVHAIKIKAYRNDRDWASTFGQEQDDVIYVLVNGTSRTLDVNNINTADYKPTGRNVEVTVQLISGNASMGTPGLNSISAALKYTAGGNGVCFQAAGVDGTTP